MELDMYQSKTPRGIGLTNLPAGPVRNLRRCLSLVEPMQPRLWRASAVPGTGKANVDGKRPSQHAETKYRLIKQRLRQPVYRGRQLIDVNGNFILAGFLLSPEEDIFIRHIRYRK